MLPTVVAPTARRERSRKLAVLGLELGQRGAPLFAVDMLTRHHKGDWGVVDGEDKETNDKAIEYGNRILSAYPIDKDKPCKGWGDNTIWIITEADRSVTTILLPSEY